MFKKEVIEKTIEELLRNTISVQNLDMRFCVEWLEDHRNTKRVFWPEKFGIIAPFEKKFVSGIMGYGFDSNIPTDNMVVLFNSDLRMKHLYYPTPIRYEYVSDKEIQNAIDGKYMFRIVFQRKRISLPDRQ